MNTRPYIVGLAGGSASGKSRFISELFRNCCDFTTVISLDDFYKPIDEQEIDEQAVVNFDLPQSINREFFHQCVTGICSGQDVEIEEYHFNNPERTETTTKTLKANPIIIVEGLFVFHFKEIWDLLDLSIFIDADENVCYQRRKKRDMQDRGISGEMIDYQWKNHVSPAFEKYLKPFKSKVDLVINNNKSFEKPLRILQQHLEFKAAWQANLR